MPLPQKAVSAPGKVLLTGGYLVLDRQHTGLVFALDARIHVHIQPLPTADGVILQEIVVQSPQFRYAEWRYGYRASTGGGGIAVTHLTLTSSTEQQNPFVETALAYALTYISTTTKSLHIDPAWITILANNDYYSQGAKDAQNPKYSSTANFKTFNVPIWEAHKTGLGSSAALVTAFIAAVLSHYLPAEAFDLATDLGKQRLHNLAQAAHCAAQGKVGSGFDVASAVFGSCVYRRFSPSVLESCGHVGSANFASQLDSVVENTGSQNKWDMEITKSAVAVPIGLRLVMCDVDCGSKTPGMVKQVLAWRKAKPDDADRIWGLLQNKNDELAAELVKLAKEQSSDYTSLKQCIASIRSLVRKMSLESGVPIEPDAQTKLLDACTEISGVVGGVTPGAGGFDAVALLIEDREDVLARLAHLLQGWKFDTGSGQEIGKVRLLGVREETGGVRLEEASSFENWTR